jgi:hypothetical protein
MEQDPKLTQDVREEMERHLASVADALRRSGTAENEVQSVLQDLRNQMMELLAARAPQPPTLRDIREIIAGMAQPENYAEPLQTTAKREAVPPAKGRTTLPDNQRALLIVFAFLIILAALALCFALPTGGSLIPALLGFWAGLSSLKWAVKGARTHRLTGGSYLLSDSHRLLLMSFGFVLMLAGLALTFAGCHADLITTLLPMVAGMLFLKWAVRSAPSQVPAATARPGTPAGASPTEAKAPLSDTHKRFLMVFGFLLILAGLALTFLRWRAGSLAEILAIFAGLIFVKWAVRPAKHWARAWLSIGVIVLAAVLLYLLTAQGCSSLHFLSWMTRGVAQGSGHVITENRALNAFSRISASGISVLNITQGEPPSLTVEADDNILPLIETEVNGDTLRIGYKLGKWSGIRATKPVTVSVTMKRLSDLDVSGSIQIRAGSIAAESLTIRGGGATELTVSALTAQTLKVHINGSAKCDIAGTVGSQSVQGSGAIHYSAAKLRSRSAEVDISGAANVTVWATEDLDVRASGAGEVSYYGKPRVTNEVSGLCSIKSLGNP